MKKVERNDKEQFKEEKEKEDLGKVKKEEKKKNLN